jgi:hypothetical protein
MKALAIVLSAGVLAGLGVFAILQACQVLSLLGDLVTTHVTTFVFMIAAVGFASAALALAIRAAFAREDRGRMRALEERLARLEGAPPR